MRIKPASYLFAVILFVVVAFALQSQTNLPPIVPLPAGTAGWWQWLVDHWSQILLIIQSIIGLFMIQGRASAARQNKASVYKAVVRGEQVPNPPKP